ncbi:hypothetical protein D3C87_1728970 [compost metagenome]
MGSAVKASTKSGSRRMSAMKNFLARATKSVTSSSEKALARLSMGTAWRTLAKPSAGAAPTWPVGLSVRTSSGKASSSSALRIRSAS